MARFASGRGRLATPTRSTAAWVAVAAGALALRLWDLGARPYQYDEGQVAFFSWLFRETGELEYNPILHGPLTYQLEALVFLLVGDSDFTARLVAALAGVAVVLLPLGLRSRLGNAGALAAAGLFALSPAFLYYSRFDREDILVAALTLALVVVAVRMFERPRRWHPAAIGALLAASFGTKESTFITVAIAVAGLVGAQAGGWPVLARLGAPGRRAWAFGAAAFAVVFALVFSTFGTHPQGIVDAVWRGPGYWIEQHPVNRGGERWPFYVAMLAGQEWLALGLGTVGAAAAVARRDPFGLFALWLFLASLAVYSYAGERFAWLVLQPLLPLGLLAGMGVGVLVRLRRPAVQAAGLAAAAVGLALTGWAAVGASFGRGTDPRELLVVVQSAPDTLAVRDRVRAVAESRPGTVVTVDSAGHNAFPWAWWFRDLEAGYIDMTALGRPPDSDVMILSADAHVQHGGLRGYSVRPFVLRRFWGRDYSRLTPARLARWALTRRPWSQTGELGAYLYVRRASGG